MGQEVFVGNVVELKFRTNNNVIKKIDREQGQTLKLQYIYICKMTLIASFSKERIKTGRNN